MDWPTVASDIVKVAVPSIVTAVVSYKIAKFQLQTKEIELKSQADIKARELIFNAYQKKIERISNLDKDFAELFDRITPLLQQFQTEEVNKQLGIIIFASIRLSFPVYQEDFQELEEELKKANLIEKRKTQIGYIKGYLATDLSKIGPDQTVDLYYGFIKMMALFTSLRSDLLNYKCEELFSDCISNKNALSKWTGAQ